MLKKLLFSVFSIGFSIGAVEPSSEQMDSFVVSPQEPFGPVMDYLSVFGTPDEHGVELNLCVAMADDGALTVTPIQRATNNSFRQYQTPVSKKDKEKIRYIVTTLGFESTAKIATERSDLKKTGKEINHIHPLRFLMTVFTDEELKAGVHGIRGRMIGWIWSEFLDGLVKSLDEENAKQNMKMEYIQDFAKTVNIDVNVILPSIQQKKWSDFVNLLIDRIPRKNNPNRYDN